MINLFFSLILFLPLFKNPIASTFGENRSGRYHLGVDFSTFKKDGLPLYFPFETEIIRLKVNFAGYGKVLYLRDKNGFIYVLAHLQRFNSFIDSIVFDRLKKEKSNEIDLWFKKGIKIKPQNTVGYTGHSGTRIPHLHFEIRKGMDIALNPLKFIDVNDTIKPLIEKVLLIPLGKSVINSSYFPLLITRNIKEIYAKGEFLIWVKCFDKQNEENTIAPYSLKIFKDDSLIFFIKMDSIIIPLQKKAINLYYRDENSYSRSWIHPLYIPLNVNRNIKINIIAEDYKGNRDSLVFRINNIIPEKTLRKVKIPSVFYSFDGIVFRTHNRTRKIYAVLENKSFEIEPFDAGYYKEFKWIPPSGFEGKVEFIFENDKKTKREYYVLFSENVLKSMNINDFYMKYKSPFPFYFYVKIYKNEIKIMPYFSVFEEFKIKKDLKEKEYWVSKGKFAGKEYINLIKGGTFETAMDTTPPVFSGDSLIYSENPLDINFYIYDNESGIDKNSIEFYIDDKFVPVFYYPSEGRIELFRKIQLKKGMHRFSFFIADRTQNYTEIKGKILIR